MDHRKLHNIAYFVGALAHGAEQNLGRGSASICSLAGKRFGTEAVADVAHTDDPVEAVAILRRALAERGIEWDFQPFAGARPSPVEVDGATSRMRLVFAGCLVRNALFCYGHEQKESLCQMAHGVFAGAMEKVMPGTKVELEILHAGPNACLKELVWEKTS